jgi:hypothetical protein
MSDEPKLNMDNVKLTFDYFKHLTTLSTGAILFYTSIIDKSLINAGFWTGLFVYGSFLISLMSSLTIMLFLTARPKHLEEVAGKALSWGLAYFLIGMLSLIIAVIRG